MSKSASKNRLITTVVCLVLAISILAGTFLIFRPYYYNNIYLAPNPTNLSSFSSASGDAIYGDFYVGPNGSDSYSGTQEHPFATIKKAKEAVKKLNKKYRNHVVVAILAGTYDIGNIEFNEKDSGSESCRIIYAACGDGEVIFKGNAPATGENFAMTDDAVIEIKGGKYLSFSNITVDSATGAGIKVDGKNIDFSGCTVQNTAGCGIEINGSNITVANCTFSKTGSSAIVSNGGNAKKLTKANIIIENNLIYSTCVFDKKQPAVVIQGVGTEFTNNEILNTPSCAVYYSGNLNKIEYNYIHNCLLEYDAAAAVAAPQGYVNYGNFVRYNCISMLGNGDNSPTAVQPASGSTVRGNMIINVPGKGVDLNCGRDINLTNNIFINCKTTISASETNENTALLAELENSPYQSKEWKEKLPECSALVTDPNKKSEPEFALNPSGSIIENNIIMHASKKIGSISPVTEKYSTVGNNLCMNLTETDIFTDAKNGIYTISDSVLNTLSIDFSNLPFDSMGRY